MRSRALGAKCVMAKEKSRAPHAEVVDRSKGSRESVVINVTDRGCIVPLSALDGAFRVRFATREAIGNGPRKRRAIDVAARGMFRVLPAGRAMTSDYYRGDGIASVKAGRRRI